MTVYTKSMMESLAEVRDLQLEDNMELMRKAAGGSAQNVKMKDGKLKMDAFTASAIMKVYDKVNPANKKKIETIINSGKKNQMMKLQSMAMKAIKSEYDAEIEEEVELDEGRMKELHGYIEQGKKAEWIAKKMKLDVKTIKALMGSDASGRFISGRYNNEAYELGTDEYRKYTQDVTPGEVDEASARADARRHGAMRGKEVDPADVDTDASDADVKAASKNIMMQMRKVISLGGRFDVEFLDKKKIKVKPAIANAFIKKYQSMRRPADKEKFQNQAMKSYKDLLQVLKSQYMAAACMPEEVELDEFTISDLKGMGIKPTPAQMKELQKINDKNRGNITRADLKKVGIKEDVELDEALPPHLQKFFDKDGNPKSKEGKAAWERIKKTKMKGYTPKQIKMAIGVAFDKRYVQGNMTGAAKAIEKIAKGLSDFEPVANALQRANENTILDRIGIKLKERKNG